MVLRVLMGAWLIPAVALMWIGLATTGLRSIDSASLGLALGRTQASVVLLTVFTVLTGASTFVRRPQLVAGDEGSVADRGWSWLGLHLLAASTAVFLAGAGKGAQSLAPTLWPLAALCGFAGGLALPRALVRLSCPWAAPVAALAAGMVFQLTVGWLHVVHPAGMASPALIVEGLILAWAAVSASRSELGIGTSASSVSSVAAAPAIARPGPDRAIDMAVPGFGPPPAPPSFVEPVVGH